MEEEKHFYSVHYFQHKTDRHRRLEVEEIFEKTEEIKYLYYSDEMDNVTITDLYYTYEITLNDGVLVYFDEEGEKHFFNIEEIVFHAPSEHTFDGENYDLEM